MGKGYHGTGTGLFGSSERERKQRESMRKFSKLRKQQEDQQQREYVKKRMKMRRRSNERHILIGRIRFLYIPTAACISFGMAMIFGSTIPALGQGTFLWERKEDFHIAGPIVTGVGVIFLMIVSGLSNYQLEKMKEENKIRECKYCARIHGLDVSDSSEEDIDEREKINRNRRRKPSYVCKESGSGLHYVCKTEDTETSEPYLTKDKRSLHNKRRPSYVMKGNNSGLYRVVKVDDNENNSSERDGHHQKRKHSRQRTSHDFGLPNLQAINEDQDDEMDDNHDVKRKHSHHKSSHDFGLPHLQAIDEDDGKHKHHKRKTTFMCKEDEFGLYHVVKTDEHGKTEDINAHHHEHHKHRYSHRRTGSDSMIYHLHHVNNHEDHSEHKSLKNNPHKTVLLLDDKHNKSTQTDTLLINDTTADTEAQFQIVIEPDLP